MKKFNTNIIVFAAVWIIVFFGFSKNFTDTIWQSACSLITGEISFSDFTANIDGLSDNLRYHNALMDINSVKQNLTNTKVVPKDDFDVVLGEPDSLYVPQARLSDEDISNTVSGIETMKKIADELSVSFLYVAAPTKGYGATLPGNVTDFKTSNYDRFVCALRSQNIPTLDLTQKLKESGIKTDEMFFRTDHHWLPETAFKSCIILCNELENQYGFEYNKEYTDLNNFNIQTYTDYFLGSYGKKVGTYFTDGGAEDISIITPKFDTDFTVSFPLNQIVRRGTFDKTLLDLEKVKNMNYYKENPYATYSGGDFRLQIMKNNKNAGGEKILLIRDSFACALAPFLALNASELHIADLRDFAYNIGKKINIRDYIKQIKPDRVIMMYTGVSAYEESKGRFDYEN